MSSPSPVTSPQAARWIELESVRGLAAMLVVLFHMPIWYTPYYVGVIKNGYLMVELFFVLSGFVIAGAYADRIHTFKDFIRFQFLRWARLYPVHFLFLMVYLGFEFMKLYAQQRHGMAMPNYQPFLQNSWEAFFHHLLLIQGIGPTGFLATFNGPAWSISVEFYTYMVFGLLVMFGGRHKTLLFALLCMVSLAALASPEWILYAPVLRCLAGFFLGCLVARLVRRVKWALPAWLPLVITVGIVLFLGFKPYGVWDSIIFFLSAMLILALVLSPDHWFKQCMRIRPLVWLGTISYSVYMSHYAIEWVMNQVIRVFLKRPEVFFDGRNAPSLGPAESIVAHLIVIAVVLVVADQVYRRVESPCREWSRRYLST
jgi:peptidoglycan/LPS O-acetylase OafA/YrhL